MLAVAIPVLDEEQLQLAASPTTPPEALTAKTTLLPPRTSAEARGHGGHKRRRWWRWGRNGRDQLHVVAARSHPKRQKPGY